MSILGKFHTPAKQPHQDSDSKTQAGRTDSSAGSLPNGGSPEVVIQELRQELDQVWEDLKKTQTEKRPVNITLAADRLNQSELAFSQTTPDAVKARYYAALARYELAKAKESAKSIWLGYLAVFVEFLYLGLIVVLFAGILATGVSAAEVIRLSLLQVPVFVIVWGFLGGVAWCLYGATSWSNSRLFDAHYFPWYVAHPWISAVLGGAAALLIMGGLSALGAFDSTTAVGVAVLSLTSFVAGFSTHEFWKLLDRTVTKILGGKESESVTPDQAEKITQQTEGASAK